MPKYFCDYCDTFLTHDSPSVRKTHCAGRKHRENVRMYYEDWYERNQQKIQKLQEKQHQQQQRHHPPQHHNQFPGNMSQMPPRLPFPNRFDMPPPPLGNLFPNGPPAQMQLPNMMIPPPSMLNPMQPPPPMGLPPPGMLGQANLNLPPPPGPGQTLLPPPLGSTLLPPPSASMLIPPPGMMSVPPPSMATTLLPPPIQVKRERD